MGFWSSVGSVFSSAVSFVSSAVSAVGSALSSAASTLLKVSGLQFGLVGTIIQAVATLIGVLKPDDKIEELGAKALESDKKPEDFDSNAEYIDYLKNEIQLDKEKFDNASKVEKIARTAIGASIAVKGIEEKKGFDIPALFWVKVAEQALKSKEINAIIDTFKEDKLEKFVAYSEGKLDYKDEMKTGDKLVDMYSQLEPNLSKDEIESKVMKMEATR